MISKCGACRPSLLKSRKSHFFNPITAYLLLFLLKSPPLLFSSEEQIRFQSLSLFQVKLCCKSSKRVCLSAPSPELTACVTRPALVLTPELRLWGWTRGCVLTWHHPRRWKNATLRGQFRCGEKRNVTSNLPSLLQILSCKF